MSSKIKTGVSGFQILTNGAFYAASTESQAYGTMCHVLVLSISISALYTVNKCQHRLILYTATGRQHTIEARKCYGTYLQCKPCSLQGVLFEFELSKEANRVRGK